jgi:putative salt-induced outer membrane protein
MHHRPRITIAAVGLTGLALAVPAQAVPIPQDVAAMIRAAGATGDASTLKTVADIARKTNPASEKEIDALTGEIEKKAEEAQVAKLENRTALQGWKGQIQAGASTTTGTTQTTGFTLALNLKREGVRWRHTVLGSLDYARENGATTKDNRTVSYQADFKLSDRFFLMGLGSWEADRFSGFDQRFSETFGAGYAAVKTPTMTLDVTAGPALRQTRYITGLADNMLAARGGLDYAWTVRPGFTFTQNAAFYGQKGDSTVSSNSALTMKLRGALSVQAAFLIDHETNPPEGTDKTNTTSRFTLVYGF